MEHDVKRQNDGRREGEHHCLDHTGLVEKQNSILSWLKAVFAVAALASGLMAYSVVWQAPSLKTSMVRLEDRIDGLREKVTDHNTRLTNLESVVYKNKEVP